MHRQHGSSSASLLPATLLGVANLLLPIAILVFATGFFPYKPFLPGLAQDNDLPAAPFDRVIFMVVDALRSDFVFSESSGFAFTQQLIENGHAMPFTAHATSPTITMPRIKAMTTGSTPSFLDAILSFDEADTSSTLAVQDTWLAQMKAKGDGKLLLYGDDTWLKLFPGTFDRADGTSSFFVSDFTEVDNNVTRHIAPELSNDDWNTMILHFLGLDHIGHKTGPRGPSMIPKQVEMDGIVQQIYEAISTLPHLESTLFVFCGDHGMNDAGNHGASSPGETSAALVFVSPKLKAIAGGPKAPAAFAEDFQYYKTVEQSDLAPTLAALLGFSVPRNNLGAFIPDFLPFWPEKRDQVRILLHNARQIFDIITATIGSPSKPENQDSEACSDQAVPAEKLACEWPGINQRGQNLSPGDGDETTLWLSDVSKWLAEAQALMTGMASNYDVDRLMAGVTIATVATAIGIMAASSSGHAPARSWTPVALITLLYGVMMFASSYVEEEQHFWYWSTSAWVFYQSIQHTFHRSNLTNKTMIVKLAAPLALIRVIRCWNQTGQKFAGEPDLVTMFLTPNPQLLWGLVAATYAVFARKIYEGFGEFSSVISGSVVTGLMTAGISFKVAFTQGDAPELVVGVAKMVANWFEGPTLIVRAQALFMGLGAATLYPLFVLLTQPRGPKKDQAMRTLHYLYSLLALTQSRTTNIPLFLLFEILFAMLGQWNLDGVEIATCSMLLQFLSFFAMGGNNTLAGLDLSSAYNGISGFNVVAVGVLIFVSNWGASIWWTSACVLLLLRRREQEERREGEGTGYRPTRFWRQHLAIFTVFTGASLAFVMGACTALRTHLFIWTVFSPKYLYSMAWSIGQHLAINAGLGGFLYWLGSQG